MLWAKIFLVIFALFLLAMVVRTVRGLRRFRHRYDDPSAESAERLRQFVEQGDESRHPRE